MTEALSAGPIKRWTVAGRDILLAAVAAGASWWIATALLGREQPIFAAIAGVVAFSPGVARHSVQAVAMLGGIATGIACGELAQLLPQVPGPALIVASVVVAMFLAASFGLQGVMVVQAGASAIIVIGSTQTDAGVLRFADALVGACVALLFSQVLFTRDPIKSIRDPGCRLIQRIEDALTLAAEVGKKTRNPEHLRASVDAIKAAEADLAGSFGTARGIARWSVRGRIRRAAVLAEIDAWRPASILLASKAIVLVDTVSKNAPTPFPVEDLRALYPVTNGDDARRASE